MMRILFGKSSTLGKSGTTAHSEASDADSATGAPSVLSSAHQRKGILASLPFEAFWDGPEPQLLRWSQQGEVNWASVGSACFVRGICSASASISHLILGCCHLVAASNVAMHSPESPASTAPARTQMHETPNCRWHNYSAAGIVVITNVAPCQEAVCLPDNLI